MDIIFDILLCHGPQRVISLPSLAMNRADAFHWVCSHPPPAEWRGFRIIPLSSNGDWSLLVEDYRGPDSDR